MKFHFLQTTIALAAFATINPVFAEQMDVQILEDTGNRIVLSYEFPAYHMEEITINGETWNQPVLRDENHTMNTGYPGLPDVSRAIIIPDDGEMQVRILDSTWHDVKGVKIAPSKGTISRNINIDSVPYTFEKIYKQDSFWPENIVSIRDPHIMRDIRGTVVDVYPFQYNSYKETLRVLDTLTVEVSVASPGGLNTVTRVDKHSIGPAWSILMDRHFINFKNNRGTTASDDGDITVICYDDYLPNIQPYVDHKVSTGYNVNLVPVSSIGNNDGAISSYISNIYNSGDLGFVLLVGDAYHVDTGTHPVESGANDPQYGQISGSDHYPEVIVGRFSAESAADVDTQVQRTIEFEENAMTQEPYYKKATGIASAEGAGIGDDGEADWEHMNVIREKLLNDYGYTEVDQAYDTNGGSSSQLSTAFNDGRGFINYTGHGSTTAWSTTGFNNSNVNGLTNTGKLPWIVSVACVNGQFNGPTCFAEAWLRATHNGQPSGAAFAYMSSINQYWAEPMSGQDEIVDLFIAEQYKCAGVLAMAGSCQMVDEYGGSGEDMMDTWHIFGDPSLCVVGTTAPPTGLKVSGTDLLAEGPLGGPFAPDSTTYVLTNYDAEDMDWTADSATNWIDIYPTSGTLGWNETTEVTVTLNGNASDLGNGLHQGVISFINETTHDGDVTKGVSVNVGVPVPVYTYSMDSNPGWTMTGEWEFGQPTGQGGTSFGNADPSSGATGSYVCGINLNGDYSIAVGGPYELKTNAIDCTNLINTELKFQRWLNTDYQPYVTQTIEVSNNGTTWEELWANPSGSEVADSSWSQHSFDISDVADEQGMVYIRWTHAITQTAAWEYSGWNIDDVEIWGTEIGDVVECDEDVNGDGIIGVSDILAVIDNWGACNGCDADVNGDGGVNVTDLLAIVGAWGVCE